MNQFKYLIIFGILVIEFAPQCNPYVIQGWTQAKLKRLLNVMNRELYIDAYSKVGMIDYIKRNFYNTKAYEVGETLYNIKRKQADMLEQYKGALAKPYPQNSDRQIFYFVDICTFSDEIKYSVEMIRDFDKLEEDREMRIDEDVIVALRSRSRAHDDDALTLEERRARQRAYAYRQKKLMVSRSDNPGLHEHFMKKIDADEDGFASELS